MKINTLYSGGIITNYYCTSKCRHCLYGCSPSWDKKYIDAEQVNFNLLKVRSLGCRSVHVGGGEPFLNISGLEMVLQEAHKKGVGIEYVETNSSWFKDEESAVNLLKRLQQSGLRQLLVSISPFHNEFIPFFKVKGVMRACRKTGIQVFPWVMDFYNDLEQLDENNTHKLEEFEDLFGSAYLRNIPSRYWIHFGGRSLYTFKNYFAEKPLPEILNQSEPCTELTDTSHFHIDLFGNYIPGLCSGLSIRAQDLGNMLDKDKYLFITTLYSKGIKGFLDIAVQEYDFQPDAYYVSKCHLCFEIRSFLVKEKQLQSLELQPASFYDNV